MEVWEGEKYLSCMNVYEYLPFFFTFLHAFWCWWPLTHTHEHSGTHTDTLTHTYAAYLFFLYFFPSAKRVLPHFSLLYIWLVAAAATLLEFFTYKNLQRRHTDTHK